MSKSELFVFSFTFCPLFKIMHEIPNQKFYSLVHGCLGEEWVRNVASGLDLRELCASK